MTGGSELSRKLLTVMLLSASAISWAADNSIYIDQAGDNSTITMTQDGSGNKVKGIGTTVGSAGTDGTTSKLVGNAQTVNIEQTGQNNVLSLGLKTTQGGSLSIGGTSYANVGIHLNYQVTGGYNTGIIDVNNDSRGGSIGSVVSIVQDGNATAKLRMTGTENQVNVNTAGGGGNIFDATINASNVIANVSQTGGGGNETTLDITGDKATTLITTVGAANLSDVTQSGGGVNGMYAKLDINGSSNLTSITQSGGYDHIADVKIVGNSNDITVAQSGGRSAGHYAKVDISGPSGSPSLGAGSNNVVSITQQGSVDNYANLKITGSSNNYTILQKN